MKQIIVALSAFGFAVVVFALLQPKPNDRQETVFPMNFAARPAPPVPTAPPKEKVQFRPE